MLQPDTPLYKFGNFQVDTIKRVLQRDDVPVQLPSKAFDVLLALVDHNQDVMDKDELMRLVWGERIVEENNLTRHISTLRKVLDETPNDHRYIVTVPGRGYKFVAQVERIPGNGVRPALVQKNGDSKEASNQPGAYKSELDMTVRDFGGPVQAEIASTRDESLATGLKTNSPRTWRLAIALVGLLGFGGFIAVKLSDRTSGSLSVNSYRDWEEVRLTRNGCSITPTISRDGKYVAYVNHELGRESIWIHQVSTSTQQQITPPEKFSYRDLVFSADGSELYFARVEESSPLLTLYRIPVFGGLPKKLRDDLVDVVLLSTDGTRLAFARQNSEGKTEFILANSDGVEERVLLNTSVAYPAWSPDGNVIVFSSGNAESGGEKMGIREIRLSDGAQKEITSHKWQHVGDKKWLADGSGLILSARDMKTSVRKLWLISYPSGEAKPLSSDLENYYHVEITADMRSLVAQQSMSISDIWSSPLSDVAAGKKISGWGLDGLCVMPDGRIVYSGLLSAATHELWMMNADGTGRKQLTFDTSNDISPAATPDGRHIVFASNRSGHFEIWRMNTDGSNLVQLTNTNGANPPSISRDGKWVIYLSAGNLYKIPLEGGEATLVCKNASGGARVSPDGRLIAYFSKGEKALRIAVSSFPDGVLVKTFDTGSSSLNNNSLLWTPDSKSLLYSQSSDGVANIWVQPLSGTPPKQVTDFKADGIFRFDLSVDGNTLVCARGGWKHDIVLIRNLR